MTWLSKLRGRDKRIKTDTLILRSLDPTQPLPGIDIIQRAEAYLGTIQARYRHLDAATLHYALQRMEDRGLVRCVGDAVVTVPGPWGTTQRAERPVYALTEDGKRLVSSEAS